MKKLLLSLTLVAAVVSAYGQGSINFSGSVVNKLSTQPTDGSTAAVVVPNTAGFMQYGIFYGVGQSTSLTLFAGQLGVNSTSTAGIIASPLDSRTTLTNVGLGADTSPGETDLWLRIGAWSGSFGQDWQAAQAAFLAGTPNVAFGFSGVVNCNALGNPTISGVGIWENATGTNPKLVNAFVIPVNVVPEPTSFALVGLGAAALLIFRRRK